MTTFTININQEPPKDVLERLSTLKDEDIVYVDECPEMTPKMEKALACAVAQRNRLIKKVQ